MGRVAACNFSKTALVPSYIHPDILSTGHVCMCMWSSHSTDISCLPVKEIGVVLEGPLWQWAKSQINEQKSRKLDTL